MVRFLTALLLLTNGIASAQVRHVPNAGQWPDHVLHRADVVGGGVQLDQGGWTCWQWAPETEAIGDRHVGARRGIHWSATWTDADPLADQNWVRSGLASDRQHFYLSDDPAHWAEHVQAATMLRADDLAGHPVEVARTRQGRAAFEFTVEPGADPDNIGWRYRGVQPSIGPDGEPRCTPCTMPLPDSRPIGHPVCLQWNENGTLDEVSCAYRVKRSGALHRGGGRRKPARHRPGDHLLHVCGQHGRQLRHHRSNVRAAP